jgi:hypothetical protein
MSGAPPGFSGPPPGFSAAPPPGFDASAFADANGAGPSLSSLTPEQIAKKKQAWLNLQSRRWSEARKKGGAGGVDMGKAVRLAPFYLELSPSQSQGLPGYA